MNTLESRLDRIELQNQGNQFKHAIDKITRKGCKVINTTPFHFKKFEFNGNLHSNHIENEKFTNFIKTKGNMYYSVLEKTIDKIYSENYNFLKEFQLEENNYSEISEATQRLKRIIMEVNNIKNIKDVPKINEMILVKYLKKQEKRYKTLRLFVNIRENGYIDLYLIDLYHLGINAYNNNTGKYDLDTNYNTNKDWDVCISNIADNFKQEN